jgi:hypothetical protein
MLVAALAAWLPAARRGHPMRVLEFAGRRGSIQRVH